MSIGIEPPEELPAPEWPQELQNVGMLRRVLVARRWYKADWWFVVISGAMLVFLTMLALFPQWFAPHHPRAAVGARNLAPGERAADEVLISRSADEVSNLADLASDSREPFGVVSGTPTSEVTRTAADELDARVRLRIVRFETTEEMLAALDAGEVRAAAAPSTDVESLIAERFPDLIIGERVEGGEAPEARGFLLGTNQLGQDVLSRLIWGTRVAFLVGFAASSFALVVGVPLGLIAGFAGGRVDRAMSLVMDSVYAFPALILAIAIAAVLGRSIGNVVAAIAVVYIPTYFRIVRGHTLSVKEEVYIEAARSIGARSVTILRRYVFPNVIPSVAIIFSVNVADAILTGAALSFLGLGLPPHIPDWGIDLARGQQAIQTAWWLVTFPGLAVMLVVLTFTMLGEGLIEILNPRLREQ